MGTWYGERDAVPEMPSEAIQDSETGVQYPDIHLIKFPWENEGTYIRCCKDEKFEIVVKKDNKIKFHTQNKKLTVETDDWDIEVKSTKGDITFTADLGKVKVEAKVGEIELDAKGDLLLKSGGKVIVQAEGGIALRSPTSIQASSPKASGFERHP